MKSHTCWTHYLLDERAQENILITCCASDHRLPELPPVVNAFSRSCHTRFVGLQVWIQRMGIACCQAYAFFARSTSNKRMTVCLFVFFHVQNYRTNFDHIWYWKFTLGIDVLNYGLHLSNITLTTHKDQNQFTYLLRRSKEFRLHNIK